MDLGLTCMFWDMTNGYRSGHSPSPLSKLTSADNERFVGIPAPARMPSYQQFCTSRDNSQAGLFAKMCRETTQFLCCNFTEITDSPYDGNPIVYGAFTFYTANKLL